MPDNWQDPNKCQRKHAKYSMGGVAHCWDSTETLSSSSSLYTLFNIALQNALQQHRGATSQSSSPRCLHPSMLPEVVGTLGVFKKLCKLRGRQSKLLSISPLETWKAGERGEIKGRGRDSKLVTVVTSRDVKSFVFRCCLSSNDSFRPNELNLHFNSPLAETHCSDGGRHSKAHFNGCRRWKSLIILSSQSRMFLCVPNVIGLKTVQCFFYREIPLSSFDRNQCCGPLQISKSQLVNY